jgi:hypothetical protein
MPLPEEKFMNRHFRTILAATTIAITGTAAAANTTPVVPGQRAPVGSANVAGSPVPGTVQSEVPNATRPPAGANVPADANNNPGPVTIPSDGNMPGSAPAGPANASDRSNESLRNEAYSAELHRCDTMTGSDKSRCVASAQRKHDQM